MLIDFLNTEVAFHSRTTSDLRRSYFIFKLLNFPILVKMGALLAKVALFFHLPVRALIRATIFKQFCGGETLEESLDKAKRLAPFNVHTILDVAVEGSQSEAVFEDTTEEILRTIELSRSHKFLPFSVFKMSGIANAAAIDPAAKSRVLRLCQASFDHKIRCLIDAEESWFQKAIDQTATEMMGRFNRERPLIYNTIQMYRKDRLDFLERSFAHAKKENYILGVKIVRGAYLEKEREKAAQLGTPSPVFDSKDETDAAYDQALLFCLNHLDQIALVAGTHNEHSTQLLVSEMDTRKILPTDERIYFSQLFGMSDHLSFHLAKNGYNVAKYLPYGNVRVLLPYLIRRAQENTAVHGQTPRELQLLRAEIARRSTLQRPKVP